MKVEIKDIENSQKELLVEVPYEKYLEIEDKELDEILPKAKIPGFRPGKIPKSVVKKHYANKVKAQAIEKVLYTSYVEALTSNNIQAIGTPHISDVVFEENKPITYTMRVDVYPEFEIKRYKGLNYKKVNVEIGNEDIDQAVNMLRENSAIYEPLKKDRPVKDKDMVTIDFEGKKDGIAFDGGTAKNQSLVIGSKMFIPGFEEGIIGAKKGETRDLNLTFPENYGMKDLAGAEVVFTVTVNDIKEKMLPEVDDDFAKDIDPQSETLEDLKAKIKKGLQAEVDKSIKTYVFDQIFKIIKDENEIVVPYSLIKEESDRLAYDMMNRLYRQGVNPQTANISVENLAQSYIPIAKETTKGLLIRRKIMELENLTVEDKDIDNYLAFHADLQGKTVDQLKNEISAQNLTENLKTDILNDKMYKILLESNVAEEINLTKKEYEEFIAKYNNEREAETVEEKK